jgi:hypothetical protein
MQRALSRILLLSLMLGWPMMQAAQAQEYDLSDITEAWLTGPQGDYRSPSYTHWNEEGEVPVACAACHSETGFLDWLGADGTAALSVEHPATINTAIGCVSCHVGEAEALDAVPFPSGITLTGLGPSATCTVCHQGRTHFGTVEGAVAGIDDDTVSETLRFINVHYGVAAGVTAGSVAETGYHYDGRSYMGSFAHVPSASGCVDCHEPHSGQVATEGCVACHQGVDDITAIRTRHADFDGDGRTDGGIRDEIAGLHARLGDAITAYARDVVGTPIGYASGSFPYFFTDSDGDGTISEGEATFPNRYASWTPRLLRAAYNYQVVAKDADAWVHNPGYALQLLHDSLLDLSERVEVDTARLVRP